MFTASHNPKEYNGFKFYNNTGCQINDSAVAEISAEMSKIEYFSVPMGDLTGFLEEKFGLPAASANILRTKFLTADRQLFV